MSILNLKPPIYVIWVREDKQWGQEDLMYGLVHKGNSKFGHNDFKIVCEGKEKKCFFTNKVAEGELTTWEDCLEALQERDQPVGSPLLLTDHVHTFAEIAHIAYKKGIFTTDAGTKYLANRTKPPNSATLAKPAENLSLKDMFERSQAASNDLDRMKAMSEPVNDPSLAQLAGLPFLPSGVVVLDESVDSTSSSVENLTTRDSVNLEPAVETPASDMDDVTKMLLQIEVDTLKKTASEAVARYDHLEDEVKRLRIENDDLKVKLSASVETQKKFMVSSDKAVVSNDSMNDDTATVVTKKVVSALGKKLSSLDVVESEIAKLGVVATEVAKIGGIASELTKLDGMASDISSLAPSMISVQNEVAGLSAEMSNMGDFMTSMSDFMEKLSPFIKELPSVVAAKVGGDFEKKNMEIKKGFESVTSRIDTSHDALEEGIAVTNSVLENFGFGENENGVDLPSLLKQLYEDSRTKGRAEDALEAVVPTEGLDDGDIGVNDYVFGSKECFFAARGKPATFVCKCGCGACVCVSPADTTVSASISTSGVMEKADKGSSFVTPLIHHDTDQSARKIKRKLKQKTYHTNKKVKQQLKFDNQVNGGDAGAAPLAKGFSIDRSVKVPDSPSTSAPHYPPVWKGGFQPRR